MLYTSETILFCASDNSAIIYQTGRTIAMIGADAQNIHSVNHSFSGLTPAAGNNVFCN
jgi:hypothetical protein